MQEEAAVWSVRGWLGIAASLSLIAVALWLGALDTWWGSECLALLILALVFGWGIAMSRE